VARDTASAEIDAQLHRRFKARTAFEGTTMTAWLYDLITEWTDDWPTKTASYTVKAGDSLGAIAFRFYNDATRYWVIAHFNGIRNPALIHVGQQLLIPEPVTMGQLPAGESPYIFGIHDRGGESLMADKGKKGWVLVTEEIGHNPAEMSGGNYSALENAGFGVIVRLNNGYHQGANFPGTIPESGPNGQTYQDFAVRCGNFAEHSSGCHIWIIGNEMNYQVEWPGGSNGQPLTPARYADCFKRCHAEIHGRPGHENDQVVLGAVAPWNPHTTYPGNERGDWVKYLADLLALLGNKCDGIALHTYTHSPEPSKIRSPKRMDPPFDDRYFEFWVYREFMEAIPASMRGLPVYITETNNQGSDPWDEENTGWVRAAYAEIDRWNQKPTNQRIRCLILYRWSRDDQWSLQVVPKVQDDFRAAMDNDYRWWK
jgi:LysM repeat protein